MLLQSWACRRTSLWHLAVATTQWLPWDRGQCGRARGFSRWARQVGGYGVRFVQWTGARVQAGQQQGVAMQAEEHACPLEPAGPRSTLAPVSLFHSAPIHDLPPPAPFAHAHPPGTLFGPSSKPVLDPSGTICPFADAAGGWLPLLCTLNCTGVTEEVSAWAFCLDSGCPKTSVACAMTWLGFGANLPLSAMCCGMAMRLPMCDAVGRHMLCT